MDILTIVLIVVVVVGILIIARIADAVLKAANQILELIPVLDEYTRAFNEVKSVTNLNTTIYRQWGRNTRANSEAIARMFTLIEILYKAQHLTPPDPKLLESDEEQMEELPDSLVVRGRGALRDATTALDGQENPLG